MRLISEFVRYSYLLEVLSHPFLPAALSLKSKNFQLFLTRILLKRTEYNVYLLCYVDDDVMQL